MFKPDSKSYKILVGICSVVVTAVIGYLFVWAGNLDSPGDPATAGRMYTIEDVYNYLTDVDSAPPSKATGEFQAPIAGPVEITGTADNATATTLTDSDLGSYANDSFNGWIIEITGGTGSDQVRDVIDFATSTGVVTVSLSWTTNPDGTSTYELSRPTLDNVFENLTRFPATGQTASYADRDDGDLEKGAEIRYQAEDGTVTDLNTGLMWVKDGDLNNGVLKWQGALNFVASMNAAKTYGYEDWRLPNVKELTSILNHSISNPMIGDPYPFTNTPENPTYWTSTTCAGSGYTDCAWQVAFKYGQITRGGSKETKTTDELYVRAVRNRDEESAAGNLDSKYDVSAAESRMYTIENVYKYLTEVDNPPPGKGTITGIADSGGNNTLVDLDLNAYIDDYFNGWTIEITAGTGSGESKTVSDFVSSTGTVTVSENWTTNPDDSSEYELSSTGFAEPMSGPGSTVHTLDNVFENLTRFPATGQITCYDENGALIGCAETGQDGQYQKGAKLSYGYYAHSDTLPDGTPIPDGVVYDYNTGLMWVRHGDLYGGVRNWQEALTFVAGMNAEDGTYGYTDWRLPNLNELLSIVNYGKYSPAIDEPPFTNTQTERYWSSTSYSADNARWVDFSYAYNVRMGHIAKTNDYYVRAVRAGH